MKISERWLSLPSRKLKPRNNCFVFAAVGLPPSKAKRASTREGLVKLRDFVISRA